MPLPSWRLADADVRLLIDEVVASAERQRLAVTVAVVESGGHRVGLLRLEQAKLASIEAALAKAWTAALFRRPAADYSRATQPGGEAWGLLARFGGRMLPAPGGEPIFMGGECIGGIGVSGASAEADAALARAAVAALQAQAGWK